MNEFATTFKVTLSESEAISISLALEYSLERYKTAGYVIETAPAGSNIGTQRDLLEGLRAIRLGNRRGSDKFVIKMERIA